MGAFSAERNWWWANTRENNKRLRGDSMKVGSVVRLRQSRRDVHVGSVGIITKRSSLYGKFWRVAFENREINLHINEMEVIA